MSNLEAILGPALLTAAGGSFILAGILRLLLRLYGRRHLAFWAASWFSQGLYVLLATLVLELERGPDTGRGPGWLSVLVVGAALSAGFCQAGWLVLGTCEIDDAHRVSARIRRFALPILGLLGAALSLPLFVVTASPAAVVAVTLGPRALLTGPAFLLAGVALWRDHAEHPGIGRRLMSLACFVYGVHELQYGVVALRLWRLHAFGVYSSSVGFLDVLLQLIVGMSLVIWFLEEERGEVLRASERIEHLAYHDSLTGLPNRKLFLDRLSQELSAAPRRGTKLAVMFLDVDRFKVINDSLGHGFGDELLSGVARRLTEAVRRADTVARLGGDEFVLLVLDLKRDEDAVRVGDKILTALRRPFQLHGHEIYVSASLGVSLYPRDGDDAEALLKHADTAMYQAKEHGRDHLQVYTPMMSARALERLDLESDLRRALAGDEFDLLFQPVFDLGRGEVDGAEALIRWQHPGRGLLLPGDFLDLAETIGMSYELDLWVLETACGRLAAGTRSAGPLRLAVNLSALAFYHPDLVRQVEAICHRTGFDPSRLDFEVTENLAMHNVELALGALSGLKRLGVQISIDDFGVGYSSLSYLRTFPIDTVKIDKSFVRSITPGGGGDEAIPRAVIAMARSLGMEVVAEGVETELQLRFLLEEGCHRVQGFYLGRPMPWAEWPGFLADVSSEPRSVLRHLVGAGVRSDDGPLASPQES
ncbi:MAG: EAL domain-containing protein [Acidobacteria bacterium]|nr:EAL domain-containing protein [Acidobacteriota bacterium]